MIIEAPKGSSFFDAVRDVKKTLKQKGYPDATLIFNDLYITVSADSNENDIAVIYNLKHKLRQHNLLNND